MTKEISPLLGCLKTAGLEAQDIKITNRDVRITQQLELPQREALRRRANAWLLQTSARKPGRRYGLVSLRTFAPPCGRNVSQEHGYVAKINSPWPWPWPWPEPFFHFSQPGFRWATKKFTTHRTHRTHSSQSLLFMSKKIRNQKKLIKIFLNR